MALLICPECGNKVSSLADRCPKCGYPVSEMTKHSANYNAESINESVIATAIASPSKKRLGKKTLSIIVGIVFLILCIGVYSAANRLTMEESVQVQKVYNQIEAIGEVKASSKASIESAEQVFNSLSSKCQRHVKNRKKLTEARKQYDNLRAETVITAIDNIGDVGLADASKIASARADYNALTESQQKIVKNYTKLEKAEDDLNSLQIDNAISLISAIEDVSLQSEDKINIARKAVESLSESQKERVTNLNLLIAAEDEFESLLIDRCILLIGQIGSVTLDSDKPIVEAEKTYKKIPQDKQSLVTNYNVLKDARSKYDSLKKEKAEADKKAKLQSIIRVSKVWCSSPNSAGGVDAYVSFTNKSSKTIKYITWTVVPYNAVGDIVSSEIGDKSTARLSDTGPYSQGQGHGSYWYWDCVWYNSTIKSIKLTGIEIEYTDGSSVTISGNDIDYVRY